MIHRAPVRGGQPRQGFVKLWGRDNDRWEHSVPVLVEVNRSGCHWACAYPRSGRPRRVRDGDLIFMGRLVKDPPDILVYGRAIGTQHQPGRDDATDAEIRARSWKEDCPYYVRVYDAEFLAGTLSNGVSLYRLMDALRFNAFMSTQRNAANGTGNQNPRRAYTQKPAVQLTQQAINWINERLEAAFARHGKLTPEQLQQLDWPDDPIYRGARR